MERIGGRRGQPIAASRPKAARAADFGHPLPAGLLGRQAATPWRDRLFRKLRLGLMAGDPSPASVGEHLEEFIVILARAAALPGGLARYHLSHDLHLAPPPLRSAVRGGVGTPCSALRLPVSPAPLPLCALPSSASRISTVAVHGSALPCPLPVSMSARNGPATLTSGPRFRKLGACSGANLIASSWKPRFRRMSSSRTSRAARL